MSRKLFSGLFLLWLIICSPSPVTAQAKHLTTKDIHRVMTSMLEQHVDHHEISTDLIRHSFRAFIDQFDPDRTYLLESDVRPFLEMDDVVVKDTLKQYQQDNYSKHETLNRIIQQSIARAREIRSDLLQNPAALSRQGSSDTPQIRDEKRPFATNTQELGSRIRQEIREFLTMEQRRYGDPAVQENLVKTIKVYENQLRHRENQYLYTDEKGQALSPEAKGNLFALHLLKAFSQSLDSHTSYLDDQEAQDMKVRLEKGFRGIGVVLQSSPEGVMIAKLLEDSPAQRSGKIAVDDQIISINGVSVENKALDEVVDKLRDEGDGNVRLVLKRKGQEGTVAVTLKRELIAVNEGRVDTSYESFEGGILGKITLHAFYQGAKGVTSEKDVRKAIKELQTHGPIKGLILDLRENSGGFLSQAVKVAGLFITNGVIVVSKYSNGEQHYYRDMDGKVSFDGPMVVLTSRVTASAAEIVAQALQDYGVAIVVGDAQTYGKGTIQSQTVTDDNTTSHFKVTVGKYYTVSGKTPQVSGVRADVVAPSLYSKEQIGEEYLEYALAPDTIAPAYQDKLADVDAGLRPWYLRYYMPTLQARETEWSEFIPELKQNSEKRIAANKDYQRFLQGNVDWSQYQNEDKKPGVTDYQMEEATRILEDMIHLEQKAYRSKVVGP